jgi:hypothetical protein
VSRKGTEHTFRFPELAKAVAALPGATLVLDGEVAVFDEQLVSQFEFLAAPNPEVVTTPCTWSSMCSTRVAGISEHGPSRRAATSWSASRGLRRGPPGAQAGE